MRRRTGPALGSIAAVALLSLAACAARPAAEAPPVASSAPASPTPTEVAFEGPEPRLDLTCDEVLPIDELESFLSPPEQLSPVPVLSTFPPDHAASLQLGALECVWDGGLVQGFGQPEPERMSVVLSVLPEGGAAALEEAALSNGPLASPYGSSVHGPRCGGVGGYSGLGWCQLFGWVAGAWIDFRGTGIDVSSFATQDDMTEAFAVLADAVVVAVDAAGDPTARWVPTASTPQIESCDDLGTAEELGEVTGLGVVAFGPYWDGPRIGRYLYETEAAGALNCQLFFDSDLSFGEVSVLPGGEWAFLDARDDWLADGGSEIAVAGVEPGDAILRCNDGEECILDLHRQHDWIRVAFPPVPSPSPYTPELDYTGARASVVPLAEAILANVAD
ncbi:hypothetical protein ARHIZOSPH14_23910 [Agromyces rhizosphaerae]|uniref:SH3 domain-containing protein n=1 Tax=Agromyces rhizosphaerae TaxID=88374 RepID=A0A9W6CZJ3_9MICO|nr:hypothetical protein [Agromyces rhizosphaerae]GLI28149.1 hypothetical protein ARHIZOSPH14_23910 [Agromyces rhizosphaerae]